MMASSRSTHTGTPKGSRTFGKPPRTKTAGSEELKLPGRVSSTAGPIAARGSKVTGKSLKKSEDEVTHQRLNADPYSLSDLDDDEPRSTSRSTHVRKRKRSFVPSEHPTQVSVRLGTRETNSDKAEASARVPRRRASSPEESRMPKLLQSRSSAIPANQSTPPRKQPRLIDALAAQRDADSDPEPETETVTAARGTRERSLDLDDEIRSLLLPSVNNPPEGRSPAKPYTPRTTEMATKSTKIKYTYSQASRGMAPPSRDHARVGAIPEEPESDSIVSSPLGPGPDAFDMSDASDVEEDKRLVIKSVHELRRAGANNRFSDELEDLLSRIGKPGLKPSTLRRNALLELSQKLRRQEFASQFRDHADRDSIAGSVGLEKDVISGFALSAVLVHFLSDRPAPHLLHKLAAEDIGSLLGRLVLVSEDIDIIASRKETNLSKHSRLTLGDVKVHLLTMNLWSGRSMSRLAPRTLALKLLDILYQSSSWDESSMISAGCLDDVSRAATELMQASSGPVENDAEFSLLVSIMESQSNVAREMDQEVLWLRRQSSNARQSLQRTLQTWQTLNPGTRLAALRMAINVTNTYDGASAFDERTLLSNISHCISSEIGTACRAVEQHRLDDAAYEGLLLVLGVMINIVEHCPAARHSVDSSSIDALATLYADNRLAMSEADSEEKSKLSVAFGYLAVLLGYLSLSEPGLRVVRALQSGQGVRKLLGSIRDFINVYKNVDSKIHGLEGLVSELQTQLV